MPLHVRSVSAFSSGIAHLVPSTWGSRSFSTLDHKLSLGLTENFKSKKVLLLEAGQVKSLAKSAPELYSNRVSAVSPTSIAFFNSEYFF